MKNNVAAIAAADGATMPLAEVNGFRLQRSGAIEVHFSNGEHAEVLRPDTVVMATDAAEYSDLVSSLRAGIRELVGGNPVIGRLYMRGDDDECFEAEGQ